MNLPRETPVAIADHNRRRHVVPGRTYRGLAMVRPYDLRVDPPALVPQRSAHPRWSVWHLASGLHVGDIRGRVRAAWAATCRLANAADWTRPQSEVCRDPECRRLWRLIPVVGAPQAEEVLP